MVSVLLLYLGHLLIYELYSSTFIIRLEVGRDRCRKVHLQEMFLFYRKIRKTEYSITHPKKIQVIHNVSNVSDEEPRSTPQNGFYTKEKFDEIIDEMELRDPPVDIRNVISVIFEKPSETERKKKSAKHSFELMILDATEPPS